MALGQIKDNYKDNSVDMEVANASPHKLVEILISHAISSCQKAKLCHEKIQTGIADKVKLVKVKSMAAESTNKAKSILEHLINTINTEVDDKTTVVLFDTWTEVIDHITQGNKKREPQDYKNALDILKEMKNIWATVPETA